ncbi:hypothetical protein EUX98_g8800 [Antrodiella citrinella]|uniref:Uncharacterized protein n=1 Tax=Antrodiella citrinella TaxID=2447956 RepID=A0A4S4M338_9APHY|nr:hypothetical protein EUX98_g8800 [Antrodiella citrinella]
MVPLDPHVVEQAIARYIDWKVECEGASQCQWMRKNLSRPEIDALYDEIPKDVAAPIQHQDSNHI